MSELPMTMPEEYEFTGEELVREMQREHGKRLEVYERAVAAGGAAGLLGIVRRRPDAWWAPAAAAVVHVGRRERDDDEPVRHFLPPFP